MSSGPDWTAAAPVAQAAAPVAGDEAWGAPPPAATESAWTLPASDATLPEWTAAAAPPAPRPSSMGPSAAQQMLEDDPEPLAQEPKETLFATLAMGESLSEDEPAPEENVRVDEDPDLPVAVEEGPRTPLAQIATVAASGLTVQGEHRVAVHTRGGRTLRGSVRDIDLSRSQFELNPQGGADPETIYHSDVKAIFFMLSPGEKPRAASGAKVRVTFADGRSIDGHRDGNEGKHGFFLVPTDAARTNTRRIYVAGDAISELKDG